MSEQNKDAERAAFEAWLVREWPTAPLHYVRDALPKNDPRYGEYCDESLRRAWASWQARASLPVGVPQVQITGHLDEVDAPLWAFIHAEAQKLERTTGRIDTYNFTRPNGAQPNGCVAVLWNGQTIHAVGLTVRDALNRTQCVRLLAAAPTVKAEQDGMCNADNPAARCICREEFGERVCAPSLLPMR